ncbi:hypothetical protein PRIPAC_70631 [Pristionchus pacificus]|uniref:Uncharacterized protein n=1 Tax=Pristionchus pacificus TaxID=54126 RepID=A0A2A6CRB9_PRIPA|nr:hypothetical protein PRIPAC_70631 [Pristionchus pacificus]|eukprot:PDM80638.1 hypothetical protein PRIPAC_35641 [Pristionchus pacificus]
MFCGRFWHKSTTRFNDFGDRSYGSKNPGFSESPILRIKPLRMRGNQKLVVVIRISLIDRIALQASCHKLSTFERLDFGDESLKMADKIMNSNDKQFSG